MRPFYSVDTDTFTDVIVYLETALAKKTLQALVVTAAMVFCDRQVQQGNCI